MALWIPNHCTREKVAGTEDLFPVLTHFLHDTGQTTEVTVTKLALLHVLPERSCTSHTAWKQPAISELTYLCCTSTWHVPGGPSALEFKRSATSLCCALEAFCKRTFRCRLLSMPSVSTAEAAKLQRKRLHKVQLLVLPRLMSGMCWTGDMVKRGRQPCQILCVHNWIAEKCPCVNERPQVHITTINPTDDTK